MTNEDTYRLARRIALAKAELTKLMAERDLIEATRQVGILKALEGHDGSRS